MLVEFHSALEDAAAQVDLITEVVVNPNGYLLWAILHPTATAHRILGSRPQLTVLHAKILWQEQWLLLAQLPWRTPARKTTQSTMRANWNHSIRQPRHSRCWLPRIDYFKERSSAADETLKRTETILLESLARMAPALQKVESQSRILSDLRFRTRPRRSLHRA